VPTGFAWIIQDQIAVCERPGGFGASHRRVRRQEEIIWIRENDFDAIVSLLASDHNLHNYDELDVAWTQLPFSGADDGLSRLIEIFERFEEMTGDGRRIIVHRDELNDIVCGLMAAFLLWRGLVPTGPRAISITEQLLSRPLGNLGRRIVALVVDEAPDPHS
tara:strand:+ start:3784 stop:4269 length:486 start_codon:yes stop_codon:yes gene_type:complete